jgi:hypothetical protein
MRPERVRFTPKDILCEAGLWVLRKGDLAEAVKIVSMGVRYNRTVEIGDAGGIADMYRELPEALKTLKHNFLSRGKGHW